MERRVQLVIILALITLSLGIYILHYLIFEDAHHILIYLVGDIAFVPIEVLLVTVVLHELLERRRKILEREKVQMLIGAFFSKLGTDLLAELIHADPSLDAIGADLLVTPVWTGKDFERARQRVITHTFSLDKRLLDISHLHLYLQSHEDFLTRLQENPFILEHETFTELLRTISHLVEELERRKTLVSITPRDRDHLVADCARILPALVTSWLLYMEYLKDNYPYLASLAIRVNPFNPAGSPIVKDE